MVRPEILSAAIVACLYPIVPSSMYRVRRARFFPVILDQPGLHEPVERRLDSA